MLRGVPKDYYVYILTNTGTTVLYTGVTNDLKRRVYEHRTNVVPGFTSRFGVHRLVYYEAGGDIGSAIEREKAIKGGSRKRKITLVDGFNPTWRDLYDEI
jgi:putative endonuclease